MAQPPLYTYVRLTFTTPFSTQVQWQGGFWSGDDASGSLLAPAPNLQTSGAGTQPGPYVFATPAASRSYRFTVFGYFGSGQVGVKIEGALDASMSAPITLFQGPVIILHNYQANGATVSVIPAITTPCAYGTQLQPTAQLVYYLVPSLIDAWLVEDGLPWLAALFTPTYFSTLNAQTICQSGPPAMPVIDLSTLDSSRDTIDQVLRTIAWPNICECTPGAPAPVPYPLPTATEPAGWPTFPTTVVTTPGDPAALQEILRRLSNVEYTQAQIHDLVFSTQRYKSPFAARVGRRFEGVLGEGELGLTRVAGIHIDVTTEPPGKLHLPGNPDYIKDLGWISISSASGMLDELRVSQTHRDWFT
jgi:hypothetical protein